jgi:hypothetical protein
MHQHGLNLLQHPKQAKQQKIFHHVWTACAGVWVGCGLALAAQIWLAEQTAQMQLEHTQLKALVQARARQAQAQATAQSQRKLLAEQLTQTQAIARHQQDWVVLHETLQNQAQQQGLRLTRWTAQDGQIQWHGHMDRFEAMATARQFVAAQLEQPVQMVSTNAEAGSGVDFVWQTPWGNIPKAEGVAPVSLSTKAMP